jgi:hypothetical protein
MLFTNTVNHEDGPLMKKHFSNHVFIVGNNISYKNQLMRTYVIFFTMAQQPPVGKGLLIVEDSWSLADTPHSVGLLWMSDQLRRRDLYLTAQTLGGIWTRDPSKRSAADPRLSLQGPWDRHTYVVHRPLLALVGFCMKYWYQCPEMNAIK